MKKISLVLACVAVAAAAHGVEFALGVGAYEGRAAFKELRITDAAGKVVYSNDFATPDAVKGWLPAGRGVWKCGGGTLEQTFGGLGHEAVTLSIPQKFRNVTLTVKAKKIDGKEGFIVATGKNLIVGGGEWVIFGGWVNTQHGIEQPPFAIKKVPGSIKQGRWYDVKVECMDDRIRAWLDGRLVVESLAAVDTSGRPASIAPVKGGKAIKYSPMIFGQFIEHHDRQVYGGLFWPGHPLSDEDGFRKDVIEALREIKVPIVRWPGGCFVSAYHWKYGIGPKRQPMWDKAWEVEDPNTFGTDEYVKWCRKVGCEPYICTNAGSGNEEEMSDWVEYCNLNVGKWGRQRIANGYPKPHDVLYWSVGNENWGGWEMGAKTVAQWGPLVRESAKMMRGTDRRIYLLAAATPNEGWTLPLLKAAGYLLDYVSIHDYYGGGPNQRPYLEWMMQTGRPEATIVQTINILKKAGFGGGKIGIAFDEWNMRGWYHPRGKNGRMDHAARRKNDIASLYNMSDAVFTANFLNACLRHCETVKMACFSPVVNTRGAVFVHDKGIVKRTTYHVFWMYTHLLQPNVVPVSVDCGNLSDGWRVVPAVDAILTASDDGKRRVLAVVNKSPDKAVSFDISSLSSGNSPFASALSSGNSPSALALSSGWQTSASANGWPTSVSATVLSGTSTDDYNDIGAENRVVPVKTTFEVKDGKVSLPPHSISIIDLSAAAGGCDALKPVAMQDVKVDGFWRNQYRRLICKWIPHCIRQMEAGGKGEELLNLVATGEVLAGKTPSVKFKGCPWSDAYVYNTMEAISLALEISPGDDSVMAQGQRRLREKMEEWIPIILAAQEPSGYIHSFHDLRKKPHFTKAGDHEFYVMGYFIEMGVAHWRMTKGKDRRLFDAAIKCADHLDSVFGPAPKRTWLNGHPGLEYALCRLADAVNASDGAGKGDKYARLSQHFIRNQHVAAGKNYGWQSLYHQAERPATEMKDATGHAVRATYFYTAMSALASRLGDKELGVAADRLFDSAINRKEYLTGGVGASWRGEAFAGDYELANNGYCESCASCGMSFWTIEQHKRHGDSWPVDVQERLMYNNLLGSISEDGCNFYYQNPLDSSKVRYPWHGCPCCVGNIPRTLLALKDLAYSLGADGKTLYADHFLSAEGSVGNVAGTRLSIRQVTDYPWSGKVKFTLAPESPVAFTFALRVPDKTDSALYTAVPDVEGRFTVTVNGKKTDAEFSRGYARIARTWKAGDVVELEFPMPVQRIQCDERVQANRGRVAFQRGPVVYSFEQIDNSQPLSRLVLDPGVSFQPFWKADLCDGVFAIKGSNGAVAVPNFARLNRGEGRAMVWMVADPVKAGFHKGVFAKVSVSFSRGSMTPNIPKANDTEVKNGNFDFWPHLATKEWIRYNFDEETEFSKSAVVWFDDRAQKGNCRYPASWTLSALQGDGSWKKLAESHTPVKDGWDEVSFAPVKTRALRLDVQLPPGFSAGVREWKVD